MRIDMRKVLTERPRVGSSYTYHDVRARLNVTDPDDLPSHQGMRRPHIERKNFSDLLGPLRRFLWSSIGRPWNDVWSEICMHLSDNTVDSHLKDHVRWEIETETVCVDDVVYSRSRWNGLIIPDGLYVDPRTGLVCGDAPKRSVWKPDIEQTLVTLDDIVYIKGDDDVLRPRSYSHKDNAHYSRKIIGFEREAVYVAGFWYWVVFASVPLPSRTQDGLRVLIFPQIDFVTSKTVREGRYRAAKLQMAARDLRRHGLTNE